MTKISLLIVPLILMLLLSISANVFAKANEAMASLENASSQSVGTVAFREVVGGVRITVQVTGLPPGRHGIHIHAVGSCIPPNFTSAGAHFDPFHKFHGLNNPNGPHAGDLANLEVAQDGTGSLEYVNPLITMGAGAANSLFQPNGTSFVIHANPDDQMTDPSGKSGPRIGCGVILGIAPTFLEQYDTALAIAAMVLIALIIAVVAIRRKKAQKPK